MPRRGFRLLFRGNRPLIGAAQGNSNVAPGDSAGLVTVSRLILAIVHPQKRASEGTAGGRKATRQCAKVILHHSGWAQCNIGRTTSTSSVTLPQGCIRSEGTAEAAPEAVRQAAGGVAQAVGGGYCRLQMPLRPALAVRWSVAGHRLGALEGEGGGGGSALSSASLPYPEPEGYNGSLLGTNSTWFPARRGADLPGPSASRPATLSPAAPPAISAASHRRHPHWQPPATARRTASAYAL